MDVVVDPSTKQILLDEKSRILYSSKLTKKKKKKKVLNKINEKTHE